MPYDFMKFQPCNTCCTCLRFHDEFDCRAELEDGEWEVDSGSWNLVRTEPDKRYGFIRWTWGEELQCECPEGPDVLAATRWVRTASHRYAATVVERLDAYTIVLEFETGFGFVVGDQLNVRFVAPCTHADWYRFVVVDIEDLDVSDEFGELSRTGQLRVTVREPTESLPYPTYDGDYTDIPFIGDCAWATVFGSNTITVSVVPSGGECKIRVELDGHTWAFGQKFAVNETWEKSLGESPPDCCAVSGEELSWVNGSGDFDGSGAVCTVTATGGCAVRCERCGGDGANAPLCWDVNLSGIAPDKPVTVRQRLDKLGTAGEEDSENFLLTLNLYEGHGFVVNDFVRADHDPATVNYLLGYITEVGELDSVYFIVVKMTDADAGVENHGFHPDPGDKIKVVSTTHLSPCEETHKPDLDGASVGEIKLTSAWASKTLKGNGRARITRHVNEENFHIGARAIRATGPDPEDRTYTLHFGCKEDTLETSYRLEWVARYPEACSGTLTKSDQIEKGEITLVEPFTGEVGDEITFKWQPPFYSSERTFMHVSSISGDGLKVGIAGGWQCPWCRHSPPPVYRWLPAKGIRGYIVRLDSLVAFAPEGQDLGKRWWQGRGQLNLSVWTDLAGKKVISNDASGTPIFRSATATSFTDTGVRFACKPPEVGELEQITIRKIEDECPNVHQKLACCVGAAPSCLKVEYLHGSGETREALTRWCEVECVSRTVCYWDQSWTPELYYGEQGVGDLTGLVAWIECDVDDQFCLHVYLAILDAGIPPDYPQGGNYLSDPLGPCTLETPTPNAASNVVHGTVIAGDSGKCEFDDGDRWVVAGVEESEPEREDGLEVVCMFTLTDKRVPTELTVNCHFREGVHHADSVTINDGTHVSGTHLDTHEEDDDRYVVARKDDDKVDSVTINDGTHFAGTCSSTHEKDGKYYVVVNEAGNGDEEIDVEFRLSVPVDRTPGELSFSVRYVSDHGGQLRCSAWNNGTSAWDQITVLGPSDQDAAGGCTLADGHVDGTGVVLIRFASVGGADGDRFYTDLLEITHEIDATFTVPIPPSRRPGEVEITLHYCNPWGTPGEVDCFAWNYETLVWDQVNDAAFPSSWSDRTMVCELTSDHMDEDGNVLIRLASTGGVDGDELHVNFMGVRCELEPTSVEVHIWNFATERYETLPNDCQPTQMSAVKGTGDQTFTYYLHKPGYVDFDAEEVRVRFMSVGGNVTGDEFHLDHAVVTGQFKVDCFVLDEVLTHVETGAYTCRVWGADGAECND